MAVMTHATSRRDVDQAQVRLVYLACLPVFLLATAILRLVPALRRERNRPNSILREASAAARTCASLSLLG